MDYKEKLKRNIWIFYITSFTTALLFYVPIWVSFERRFMDFSQMAMLASLQLAIQLILELPTGAVADLFGRRNTIIGGLAINLIGFLFLGFSNNIPPFFIGSVIVGIGTALISGANTALVYDTLKSLGKESLFPAVVGKIGFLTRIGLTAAVFLGGYLYQTAIWLPYVSVAIANLISMALLLLVTEPAIDSQKFTVKIYINQIRDGFNELTKSTYIRLLAVYYTLVGGITWSTLLYFNQPFAKDLQFSDMEMSFMFGILYLSSSLVLLFMTNTKLVLARTVVFIGFPVLMIVAYLPGLIADKVVGVMLLFLVLFVGSGRFAFLDGYANEEFSSTHRATALSALNMLVNIFFIIVVGASGMLQDAYDTKLIFTLLGVVSLFLVLPLGIILARHKK